MRSQSQIQSPSLALSKDKCFHCGDLEHWSRNCKKYLEDTKKKGSGTSTLGIYVIEINLAVSSIESWVFDTGVLANRCRD
jgi:hypothetical protein